MSDAAPSRWDDYLDVFVSPSRLFERRSDGKFGQAMLVFVIAATVIYFATRTAMQPIMDAEFARGMAANPNLTPEQIETGKKFAGIATSIFTIVGWPVIILIVGAIICMAVMLVGKRLTYSQGATIAAFAMFPRLVDFVVSAVQALLMDESTLNSRFKVSLGVGRFLDPDSGVLIALAGRLDVFTLWITLLIGIGIKVMTKATTGQAALAAAFVWLVGAFPALLGALRAG
jgi:hypothetical protein